MASVKNDRLLVASRILQGIMANPEVDIIQAFLDQNFLVLKGRPGEHYEDGIQNMYADLAISLADKLLAKLEK